MAKYGTDEYGRYEEIDGVKHAIEPFPYLRSPIDLWFKLIWRKDIIRWHIGMWRQKYATRKV